MGDMPVPRAALTRLAMLSQSWAVNIMSAMKQSMPAMPATSTMLGWLNTYAQRDGFPFFKLASNLSVSSLGKSTGHL